MGSDRGVLGSCLLPPGFWTKIWTTTIAEIRTARRGPGAIPPTRRWRESSATSPAAVQREGGAWAGTWDTWGRGLGARGGAGRDPAGIQRPWGSAPAPDQVSVPAPAQTGLGPSKGPRHSRARKPRRSTASAGKARATGAQSTPLPRVCPASVGMHSSHISIALRRKSMRASELAGSRWELSTPGGWDLRGVLGGA